MVDMNAARLKYSVFCVMACMILSLTLSAREKSESLYPVLVKGKWGYINRQGKIVIEPRFFIASEFSDGMAKIYKREFRYGYIDQNGKAVIRNQSESADDFHEGLARVKINEKYGFIDKTGKMVIETKFMYAGEFSEGLAAVHEEGKKWGYINKTGKYSLLPKYRHAEPFSEGLAFVYNEFYKCYPNIRTKISGGGEKSMRNSCINIDPIFIDHGGNKILGAYGNIIFFDYIFSEGLVIVGMNDLVGYMDKSGKVVIEPEYEYGMVFELHNFHEGLACVKKDGKYGYIDNKGNMVIKPQFDECHDFSEGLASVCIHYTPCDKYFIQTNDCFGNTPQKCFFINMKGRKAFEGSFRKAGNFKGGVARVEKETYLLIPILGKFLKMANDKGHTFLSKIFIDITDKYMPNTFRGNKMGYIKKDGTWLWKPTR